MPVQETWLPAPGFPDYAVSDAGRLMRTTAGANNFAKAGRILKTAIERNGYERTNLTVGEVIKRICVHALVCQAFHGPKPTRHHEVAHRDGKRSNNAASNLRWATRSENHADKVLHGTAQLGERNGNSKFSDAVVLAIRADPRPLCEIAADYNISISYASGLRSRRCRPEAA